LDIFNEIKEQLSSCPERTRALCRTVWGAVSTSLSTALTAASIEAGDARDDGGGGGGGGGGSGGADGGRWCTTITTAAATTNGGATASANNGGRFATIMGAVKSRTITNADVDRDEHHPHPHAQHQQQQQQHPNSHSMLRNGHYSASTGGTLQKQDLRYDIGSSSQYHHVRQPSVRSRSQQPMPTTDELDRRFAKVLVSFQYKG